MRYWRKGTWFYCEGLVCSCTPFRKTATWRSVRIVFKWRGSKHLNVSLNWEFCLFPFPSQRESYDTLEVNQASACSRKRTDLFPPATYEKYEINVFLAALQQKKISQPIPEISSCMGSSGSSFFEMYRCFHDYVGQTVRLAESKVPSFVVPKGLRMWHLWTSQPSGVDEQQELKTSYLRLVK